MISIKNLDVIFNKGTKFENHVLKKINLNINDGEFITVIGGNGAGKSTLMNIISGNVSPTTGQIAIDNLDITNVSAVKRSKYISRVFQDPMIGTFADLTIEENMSIAYTKSKKRGYSLYKNIERKNLFQDALSELEMGLEDRLSDMVSSLSGGQRQALSLVMATMLQSQILLLDEHTSALDPKIAAKIMELTDKIVKQHKLTTLMITHSMSQALRFGERTIMLQYGNIVKDMNREEKSKSTFSDLMEYFE